MKLEEAILKIQANIAIKQKNKREEGIEVKREPAYSEFITIRFVLISIVVTRMRTLRIKNI